MTSATNRFITPVKNIESDVAVRVDEWLREISTWNPIAGSNSSRSDGASGLSDLSPLHDNQPIQWLSETSPSDRVRSRLDHVSLAAPQAIAPRHGSAFSTARPQRNVAILLPSSRLQNGRPPAADPRFIFPASVPNIPRRLHHPSGRSHIGTRGPTPSTPRKGKGPELLPPTKAANAKALKTIETGQDASICGICQEEFYPTSTPLRTAHAPTSSLKSVQYGLYLQCPSSHGYCLDCLTSYIRVKLEDKEGHARFPVRCPECPSRTNWEIDDETAGRVLVKDLLDAWHLQRLLASLNMFYCPNPKCSEAIEIPEDIFDIDRTECPACHSEICSQCRSMWHVGLTCEDAKNPLPDEEALQRLAARNHWRKCPRCGVMVERTEGCNHMTCRCGEEFCFACGAHYAGGCTRIGGCDGQWRDPGGVRGTQPLEPDYTRQGPHPPWLWARPQPLLLRPPFLRPRTPPFLRTPTPPPFLRTPTPPFLRAPTPPQPTSIRFPGTPIVPVHHEIQQQESTVVSRPRRLRRRRQDSGPAPIQVERPRKLSRPRPVALIPVPSNLSIPRRRDYTIPRLWRPGAGDSMDQEPDGQASPSARPSSGSPTEEEWVLVNSNADIAGHSIIMQSPILAEGARAPNTRVPHALAASDARNKPLPPPPASPMRERNTTHVESSSRLAFPPRPRRDSEQSGHTRRGFQPLRLPRLSLPGRSRP